MTALFVGAQVLAADPADEVKAARAITKAESLEENVVEGGIAVPAASNVITKPETAAVDPVGDEPIDEAIICLSRTVYWETRGEQPASMAAIANVVMNRLGHAEFPDTICGVVKQGQEQGACQFSWWCDGRPDDAEDEESYAQAKEIARKVLNKQLKDQTGGALYFHDVSVTPSWSAEFNRTTTVGKFAFYKPYD